MLAVEVLAHRGLWKHPRDGNSLSALRAALEAGYGLETDIRDCQRELVISHDPPDSSAPALVDLLDLYTSLGSSACLALNVKADGLARPLASLLRKYNVLNYFVFDMSIPDLIACHREGLCCFTRHSEVEPEPACYDRAAGVWLDAFTTDWFQHATIEKHLAKGKDVCVVSSELHGREPTRIWNMLASVCAPGPARLMICTDRPADLGRPADMGGY